MKHTHRETELPGTPLESFSRFLDHEVIVGCVLFSLLLFGQSGAISLPYHWDAMAAVFDYSDAILKHRFWPFPKLEFDDPGHPPFYYEVLALAWKLGGQNAVVAHYVGLAFAWLALFHTYLFGRNILESSLAGVLGATLLLFNPLAFAQWGHLNNEVPLTALLIMSTYYLALDRWKGFVLCASALGLTKAYGVVFVAIIIGLRIVLFDLSRITLRRLIWLASPVLVYATWFALHYHFTGIWLNAARLAHVREVHSTVGEYWSAFRGRFHDHFLGASGLISLSCLLAVMWFPPAWNRKSKSIALLGGSLVLGFMFLSLLKAWIPRYAMIIYPYFFLLASTGIARLLEAPRLYCRTLGFVIVAFSLSAYAARYDLHRPGYGSFEENSEYVDVVLLNMDVCRYIENEHSGKRILAGWPLSHALSNPALGYVNRRVQVVHTPSEPYDLFLYTADHESDRTRELRKGNPTLVRRFERNGKFVELYQRP